MIESYPRYDADVKKCLATLRGKGMTDLFSWQTSTKGRASACQLVRIDIVSSILFLHFVDVFIFVVHPLSWFRGLFLVEQMKQNFSKEEILPVQSSKLSLNLLITFYVSTLLKNYKTSFIWIDLSDYDVIHPLLGSGEYLVKTSELIVSASKISSQHLLSTGMSFASPSLTRCYIVEVL